MASRPALRTTPVVVPPRSRARTALRAALLAVLVAAAGLVVLSLASLSAASAVRARLEEGRSSLERGRDELLGGDPDEALSAFRTARLSFGEATAGARTGSLRLFGNLPVLGRNVDVMDAIARAGRLTSQAGVVLSRTIVSMPAGLDSLLPRNGRVPVEELEGLAGTVRQAHELAEDAVGTVRASPRTGLLPPLARARSAADGALGPFATSLATAAELLEGMPAFFGLDGPRVYLFGAENPAELRGTGGLVGAYSLLRVDDGRLAFSSFRPVQSLPLLDPADVEPPNDDYARLYDPQRSANGFWLNANMTPDFPSAAVAFERGFEQATGTHVDGFVTADPFALQALLRATGPTYVPRIREMVSAETVVPFLTNEAYGQIEDSDVRKQVLGSVSESVVGRFLDAPAGAHAVRALVETASNGHVKVHVDDADLQRALAGTSAGDAFAPTEGTDFLSVVQNNGAGNKVDHYLDRTIRYTVRLLDDGAAAATAEVELRNGAPDHGEPQYVIGPNADVQTEPGQNIAILNVYCGDCRLTRASRDGEPLEPGTDTELGSTFYQDYLKISSGGDAVVRMSYELDDAWQGDGSDGVYRLRFDDQTTVRGTELRVAVTVPPGTEVVEAPEGASVDDRTVVWAGLPEGDVTLEVAFAAPLPQRIWTGIVEFFTD